MAAKKTADWPKKESVNWIDRKPYKISLFPRQVLSTKHSRIVWLQKGLTQPQILPPGTRLPQSAGVAIAVKIQQKQFRFKLEANMISKDNVPIAGEVTVDAIIRDETQAIERAAIANMSKEESYLYDIVSTCATTEFAKYDYNELRSERIKISGDLGISCNKQLKSVDSMFDIKGVLLLDIITEDTYVIQQSKQRLQASQDAETTLRNLQHKEELRVKEAKSETDALKHHAYVVEEKQKLAEKEQILKEKEYAMEAQEAQHRRDMKSAQAKLDQKIRIDDLKVDKERAGILAMEGGLFALQEETAYKLEMARMENETLRDKFVMITEKYKARFTADDWREITNLLQRTYRDSGFQVAQAAHTQARAEMTEAAIVSRPPMLPSSAQNDSETITSIGGTLDETETRSETASSC